ncbi:Testis-expressed protein 30 [Mortierella sp. AM989]|nr:Testis-expressed protein 30 [Mortierella sp. AM989]
MSDPTEKEISISWPGKSAITVTLTTPPKSVAHSGFGLLLGPGAVAGTVASQIAAKNSEPAAPAKKSTAKGKKATAAKGSDSAALSASDFPNDFISGLILYSYPLHTPDNTKALRDQILYDIPSSTPTLFISGLKDTMCQPTLFAKVFNDMKSSPREVVQIQDADHGLGFGSSKPGQAKKEVLIESISEWTTAFIDEAIANSSAATGIEKTKKKSADVVTKKKAELKKAGDEWTVAVSTVA